MNTIPKSWNDVSIKTFIRLYDILTEKPDTNNQFWLLERQYNVVACLYGMKQSDAYSLSTGRIKEMYKEVDFINEMPSEKFIGRFKINKKKWVATGDFTKLTGGDYIDMDSLCKDEKDIIFNMNKIMAIFCKPIKFNWKKLKYERDETVKFRERSEILNQLPVSTAYPLTLFFCDYFQKLISGIADSLKIQAELLQKESLEHQATLQNIGVGK